MKRHVAKGQSEVVTAFELGDAILAALGDSDNVDFITHESGIHIYAKFGYGSQPPLILELTVPKDIDNGFQLAYDVCFQLIAETGNNDVCDLIVRERSAHFNLHSDLNDDDENEYVIYDAIVLDYMS